MPDSTLDPQPVYRIRVAVPVYLYDCFDYMLSAAQYQQAEVGARVLVSFGRQNLVGIIVEKLALDTPIDPRFKLKAISELLDEQAILDPKVLTLLTWSAQYYQFPIGEVMQSALPSLLRQAKPYNLLARTWKLLDAHAEAKITRSEKQQEAYKILKLHPSGTSENILNLAGIETATLKALANKEICACVLEAQDFSPMPVTLAQMPLTPNPDQKKAIDSVLKVRQQYKAFLLDGLTGSGKTEVYLHIMHEVLKQGKQVLVLVPEIGLTPQTISRFQSRFHCHIALLHSGLNDSKRLQAWQAAQTGKASIILGSATPSIDSYALVDQGKMQCLELNQRAGTALMPKIHLIDLKIAKKQHGISQQLIDEIKKRLAKKEQVLVFLNRRGYAPVLICESCAWQAKCPNCDANFTLHHQPYTHLHCHHCGTIHRKPEQCPACNHTELKPIGMGTAKVEDSLNELFPNVDVIRVDRDSTSRVGSWQKIYDRIQRSEPLILLGTQMLAKGHHFPYVTLVAILDIDSGLLSVDIRAPERTAQLIVQVAGRAGRGEHKGDVYLQSVRPDHPLLTTLVEGDYRKFAKQSLKERKAAQLPPYRYSALIRCESKSQELNQQFLQQHAQWLREHSEQLIEIWGPIPAPMERKAGRFHAHMVLLSKDRARLHFYIRNWWQNMLHEKPSSMKLSLDIDPQEFS